MNSPVPYQLPYRDALSDYLMVQGPFDTKLTYSPGAGKTVVASCEGVSGALRHGGQLAIQDCVLLKQLAPLTHHCLRRRKLLSQLYLVQ
ncbi:hypothetical protein RR46_02783 [Papilio xuthus]|uniref:Uncharacterized protein n=1 Tax=Papilio xuthus TaxID=66420 RepID=A0A194QHD7_PAPXU|nr:hypothetical protein RR46_02783 [Papilio xuthus]